MGEGKGSKMASMGQEGREAAGRCHEEGVGTNCDTAQGWSPTPHPKGRHLRALGSCCLHPGALCCPGQWWPQRQAMDNEVWPSPSLRGAVLRGEPWGVPGPFAPQSTVTTYTTSKHFIRAWQGAEEGEEGCCLGSRELSSRPLPPHPPPSTIPLVTTHLSSTPVPPRSVLEGQHHTGPELPPHSMSEPLPRGPRCASPAWVPTGS